LFLVFSAMFHPSPGEIPARMWVWNTFWIPARDLELTGPSWRGGLDETRGFSQPKMEVKNHQNVVVIWC